MANPVIVVSPGQIVSQGDWDALSHQHGDTSGKPSLRAATKAEMTAAALAQDEDAAFQDRPIYRYNLADGSYVEARTAPNGQDYQIIDYKPSQRFEQTHPASGTAAGGTNTSIGINPASGKPSQVTTYPDGRPPTYDDTQVPAAQAVQGQTTTVEGTQRPDGTWDNEQPREVTRDSTGKLISSKPLEGQALKDWNEARQKSRNPGGKTDEQIRQQGIDAQQAAASAAATAATTQNAETAAARGKREQEAAGRLQDPTTKQWLEKGPDGVWRPVKTEGVPTGALPSASPAPSGRLGEAAADLAAEQARINAELNKPNPTITPDQADHIMEARRQFWATALSEQQAVTGAQQTAFSQQQQQRATTLSDLANRRTSATGIANQAASDWMPLATKLGAHANGEALLAGIDYQRQSAQNFVNGTGANREVPEIQMGPAYAAVTGMNLPYGTSVMPNLQRPVLGLGAVPGSVAPGPSGATVEAANQATTAGTQPAITPLLRGPQTPAMVTPSAPQPPAVAPAPAGAGPAAPPPPITAAQAAAYEAGGINPATGDIDVRTTPTPSPEHPQMIPFNPPENPTPGAPVGLIQPSPYFLAGSSRGHVYDPTGSIQALIDDPTIHNDAVRQAVAEMYPGYPIDRLLGVA